MTMRPLMWITAAFAWIASTTTIVCGQQFNTPTYGDDMLTDLPDSSSDVICAGVVSGVNEKNELTIGNIADAVVGLINEGQDSINVTAIAGSLNSPYDANYFVQNFTDMTYNVLIHEDEEYTFRYRFQPMDSLDLSPVKYQLALTVFYENEEEIFSSTFYNETVSFTETDGISDLAQLLIVLGGLASVAGVAYVAMGRQSGGKSVSSSSNGSSADDDESWTRGVNETGAQSSGKSVVKRRRKNNSKKKKRSSGKQ